MRDVVVVLADLRSLYNVGAFFRTADGAGVKKIVCCGITGTPKNRRLWKVSLGAEKTVSWEHVTTTQVALVELKREGYQIVGAEITPTSVEYTKVKYAEKVALVFGSEPTKGLTDDVLQLCDTTVHVPMRGQKNSLNVAVVGGILMYHVFNA